MKIMQIFLLFGLVNEIYHGGLLALPLLQQIFQPNKLLACQAFILVSPVRNGN